MRKECEQSLKYCKQQDTVSWNLNNLEKIRQNLPHLQHAVTKKAATVWLGVLLTAFFPLDQVHLQSDQGALWAIQQPRCTLDGFNCVQKHLNQRNLGKRFFLKSGQPQIDFG